MLVVLASAAVLAVAGYFVAAYQTTQIAHAARPGDFGLQEGNRITSYQNDGNPDINVVNDNFMRAYSRNFISPAVCLLYGSQYGAGGCFAAGLKQVTAAVKNAFPLSCYFTNGNTNDGKVYYLEVTGQDSGTLHWVNMEPDTVRATDADFFLKVFKINNLEQAFYAMGAPYTSMSQVPACLSQETPTTTTQTGNVSVSLASDNPAAGTLVASQAAADLAHFQFTGNGTVTSLVLKRIGVSADTDISNVYLYDGARRLTDAATVANGMINFNDTVGLFTVAGSKNISVKADIGSSTGITLGVQLTGFNGNTTSISGNLFTVANGALATVTLTTNTDPAVNGTLDPASDVIAWRQTVAVGTRYVWLKGIQLRVTGSVLPGDLQNFRLYLAGAQIGSAVAQADSNGYIVFDFTNAPVRLDTGNREIKVLVDVIGGSGRNFTISFRQYADLQVTDSQYNAGIVATAFTGTFPSNGGQQSIASGTLTITRKTDSPAGDVIKGAAGAVLARYEFKASGERMKVENLRVNFDCSSCNTVNELANGAIFADGVQIGSTADIQEVDNADALLGTYTQYNLGSSLVVVPGTPRIVEIRADVMDGDGTDSMAANQAITANIVAGSSNVQRLTTLDYPTTPYTAKVGNQLTIKTGSFTAGKYSGYANQNVISPSTGTKVGHFTLTAASAENINVNTINIDSDAGGTFLASDLQDMYIKVWNDAGTLIYTSPVKATVSTTASNSYSVNFTIPQNKTFQVEVYGNVVASETPGQSLNLEIDATGINQNSSTSTSTNEADGQTVTVQSGSLSVTNGSQEVPALRADGTMSDTYKFSLTPAFDDFTLDEVYVDLSSIVASSTGAVANLKLYEGTTEIGSTSVNTSTGSASFTGLNRLLAQAVGVKNYTVKATFAQVGNNFNDTYGTVVVRLDGMKYRNSAGVATTTNGLVPASYTGNDNRVVAAYPSFTINTDSGNTLDTAPLSIGENVLLKTKIQSNGGNVGLYRLVFDISVTTGTTFNPDETTWKLYSAGTDISSLGTFSSSSTAFTAGTAGTGYLAFTFTSEYGVDVEKTLELRGTVTAIGSNYQAVTTKIGNHKTTASVSDTASNTAGTLSSTSSTVTWTDGSKVSHALTTDDWMNDYLVKVINTPQTRFISQ